MKSLFILLLLLLIGCGENSTHQNNAESKEASFSWPPVLGKEYPDVQLKNHQGELVRLKDFAGKIIIIEPIGMNCPACNAFAGANDQQIGTFANISPQRNLPSFKKLLKTYGGLDFKKADILYVHLLLYDLKMKAPTEESAKAWAKHFNIDPQKEIVLIGTKKMQGRASYKMIPGFQLIDQNFTLVSDSTGHHPKHNLYTELLPKIKKLQNNKQAFYDIYPRNTDAPQGTKYPCAFSPLPSHLKGVPQQHHTFVAKFFAQIVKAIHARLKIHETLYNRDLSRKKRLKEYQKQLKVIVQNLKRINAPDKKLQKIPEDIVSALLFQEKAYISFVETGTFSKAKGKAGSKILLKNWQQISKYYKKMNPDVKNSVYHHLCALDIY
ncbi:peroxiredoxin family protein [Candidatus Uabimicrobium sp. HlEnr_7]|uniref:peroxiredoxin family protein n=1 Tax=Candidatus Uabimicrobium helgolandensis TaxID=3095367 RepID=UPI0035584DB9